MVGSVGGTKTTSTVDDKQMIALANKAKSLPPASGDGFWKNLQNNSNSAINNLNGQFNNFTNWVSMKVNPEIAKAFNSLAPNILKYEVAGKGLEQHELVAGVLLNRLIANGGNKEELLAKWNPKGPPIPSNESPSQMALTAMKNVGEIKPETELGKKVLSKKITEFAHLPSPPSYYANCVNVGSYTTADKTLVQFASDPDKAKKINHDIA